MRNYHKICKSGIQRHAAGLTFPALQLALLYGFLKPTGPLPAQVIIELGGGDLDSDLALACEEAGVPTPPITRIGLLGASNNPGKDDADGECALDIQIAAIMTWGLSPIYVLYVPNSEAGFEAALDWVVANARALNIRTTSISWGQPENSASASYRAAMDARLKAIHGVGNSVFVASGDSGSYDDPSQPRTPEVDFPASSYVCACGATTGKLVNGALTESGWNGSGGGTSLYYVDTHQLPFPMRMVPDVAGVGDPNTGIPIYVHGERQIIGGTSAVAPMMSAFFTCLNQGWLGNVTEIIYKNPSQWTDITTGSNGLFQATIGPDRVTGLGTPNGSKWLTGPGPGPGPGPTGPGLTGPTGPPTAMSVIAFTDQYYKNLESKNQHYAAMLKSINVDYDTKFLKQFSSSLLEL